MQGPQQIWLGSDAGSGPPPGSSGRLAAQATEHQAEQGRLVDRTRQRYEQVQTLLAQGMGIKAIGRELGLARETMRRFARAQNVHELLATAHLGSRPGVLDPFTEHLHQRWNEGCTNATQLF